MTTEPALERMTTLYQRAFAEFGDAALLKALKPMPNPLPAHALAVVYCLRQYPDTKAQLLAEQLDAARLAVLEGRLIL